MGMHVRHMFRSPYWLTSLPVDFLTGKNLGSFTEAKDEFLKIFEKEEKPFPFNGVIIHIGQAS